MNTTTLSSKGQLVIPSPIRRALHLKAGDKLQLTIQGDRLVLEPERSTAARLVKEKRRKLLQAPHDAPLMTTDRVKELLAEFP